MPLNHVGGQVFRAPPPVTRPPINLPDLDTKAIEAEAREAQARVRVIRAGRDAWEAINRSASFESYLAIGKALAEGRRHALKVSGANAPWGRNYSREFGEWMNRHGFATMPKSTRSVAIELHENAGHHLVAQHVAGAPAQAARPPAIGHTTLASLYSARQRQMPARPKAGRQGSVGAVLRLCDGIAGG
jgi:hypothetical protein